MTELVAEALRRWNIVLSSFAVLLAFSLMAYLFVYNVRNAVARAMVVLLALITVVYTGDLFLSTARLSSDHPASEFWLRFEWLGISLAAPAFAYFAHALLSATGDRAAWRRAAVPATFLVGLASLASVFSGSGLIVGGPVGAPGMVSLSAGPMFGAFAAWHFGLTLLAALGIVRAWRRSLTPRTRRRTAILLVAAVAPLSAFPYLTPLGRSLGDDPLAFRAINMTANLAISAMLLVVAWEVAYRGSLSPERAVRRDLVKYLVHGPLLGMFVLATIQLVPLRLETSLGLPRDIVLMLWTIGGIVVYQLVLRGLQPLVDRVIFSGEGDEVNWLRRMDERLVSDRDLEQLLENAIALACDRLRATTGCIVSLASGAPQLEAWAGDRGRAIALVEMLEGHAEKMAAVVRGDARSARPKGALVVPLRSSQGGGALGVLAVGPPAAEADAHGEALLETLAGAAARALEDRLVQRRVIGALRELQPELDGIQRLRGVLSEGGPGGAGIDALEAVPVQDPDFTSWVRDALRHYWGGPKLTRSPLLRLGIVRRALDEHDQNTANAVRSVLDRALEALRPEGQRSATASEWLVYNILELKFVRGMKVRDIAGRLALSESDLYRKQRVAVEALAAQVAAMERDAPEPTGSPPEPTAG